MNEETGPDQSSSEIKTQEFKKKAEANLSVRESMVQLGRKYLAEYLAGGENDPQLSMLVDELGKAIEVLDKELLEEAKKAEEVEEEEGLDPIDVLPPLYSSPHPHIKSARRFRQTPFLK